jgi:Probable cobalt transporter subunit (CbtB)
MAMVNPPTTAGCTVPRIPRWAWPLMALFVLAVYAVGYDQGALLQPLLGAASHSANYVHELMHDGRHLLGFPCH